MLVGSLTYAASLALAATVPQTLGHSPDSRTNGIELPIAYAPGKKVVSFARTAPPKWSAVTSRHGTQVLANSAPWAALVGKIQHVQSGALLERVNEVVNAARYSSDAENWKMPDHWATPQELFERGGDCEDYAIAKYLILRELGFSPSRMEIAVSADHAVLIVATPTGPVVLDSARAKIRPLDAGFTKKILFTVNDLSWAVHVGRGGNRLASR